MPCLYIYRLSLRMLLLLACAVISGCFDAQERERSGDGPGRPAVSGGSASEEARELRSAPGEPASVPEASGPKAERPVAGYRFRIDTDGLQVLTMEGVWRPLPVRGVNMGMGKPGHFPGEAAITKAEYARWIRRIGEMDANAIRVYTLHPPAFYEALLEYNRSAAQPVYLFHGVWLDEETFREKGDAFADEVTNPFMDEIRRAVDVVHGNARLPERPGHATGHYEADVSDYVAGWILGVEWDPDVVNGTNKLHPDGDEYRGKYFYTDGARAFERWLARLMDWTALYETERYGAMRPVSFANWVTTDPLDHPSEPNREEDMASVDPNRIRAKNTFAPGFFTSYHVYPYYPDFLNHDPDYLEFTDHRGEKNPYAAYLKELGDRHLSPVLVAEFGVPSSRGMAHENPMGWNQGFLTEKEQGQIAARLYEDIMEAGMMGGIVFTWQDEWFKRTWNTAHLDDPDRRPFWSNAQTNEQQFGLLSFDTHRIRVDAKGEDWDGISPLYSGGGGVMRSLYAAHDERYLYVRIDYAGDPERWRTMIALDTLSDTGNHKFPGVVVETEAGTDFVADIAGRHASRLWVDADYDPHVFHYARYFPDDGGEAPGMEDEAYHPVRLALSYPLQFPATGEIVPFTDYETGRLRFGNGNPDAKDYDSLADYQFDAETRMLELRLPWQMLNFADPSRKTVLGDFRWSEEGLAARRTIRGITIGAVALDPADGHRVTGAFPALEGWTMPLEGMRRYEWENWDLPPSRERLKQSYYILQETFGRLSGENDSGS